MEHQSIDMSEYGFNGRFEALAAEYPSLCAGRIISQEKGLYRAACADGQRSAAVSGRFRHEVAAVSDYPAVGDFVMLEPCAADSDGVIQRVLPRKSVFVRKAAGTSNMEQVVAANVDVVFLCMSLNLDFNLRRLERYLSISWDSGASPVILLTKADLCGDIPERLAQVGSVAAGADILVTSALEEGGWEAVTPYLRKGVTAAFIGSSGVGKSTLINRLTGQEQLAVNGLRNDDKGRHTTTRRQLLLLPGGGLVMDTPGMRELGMWDSAEGLERSFEDVEALARSCRFQNCTHANEPGCAVRAAISDGTLPPERWESYRKLRTESEYAKNSDSYLAAKEKKFRDISIQNKQNRKR